MLLSLLACIEPDSVPIRLGEVRPVSPTVALAGPWTSDFGKDPASDLGPLAVLATDEGVALLDQENRRILRYDADGTALGAVPIPARATLDAAQDGSGWALLAYDPGTIGWSAQRIDGAGALLGEARVSGALDAPSGIFVDGDTVLVEQAHGRTYDVATGAVYPGRPAGDGRYVRAEKEAADRLVITWSDAGGGAERRSVITPDRTLGNVVALEARGGVTLVTLFLFEEGPAPDYEMRDPELRTVLLDEEGLRVDEISLPPAAETVINRELALAADGTLWRMRTHTYDGVALDRVALQMASQKGGGR
ncbi:MAG: hypothetical protein Q8P18_11020 [Pseudomonadota bacterium]|nr:hypothetical protein [Pseudomonadota bacterium]